MLTIRFATPADAELIADMSRETFYATFAAQNTTENMDKFLREQFSKPALMMEVLEPLNSFLLAFDDNQPVGYARMRENNTPPELGITASVEIARIYAIKAAIGKGVGTLLMQKCIDTARANGYAMIWLGVWERNERAIAFYTRWGFEKFAEHPFVLGDDVQTDWLMKKKL